MAKLTVNFRNFANAPKTSEKYTLEARPVCNTISPAYSMCRECKCGRHFLYYSAGATTTKGRDYTGMHESNLADKRSSYV